MAVRKIEMELALTGEKEFNQQMSGINSNLKTLESDMKLVSETFKGSEKSTEALTAKSKILDDQLKQQEEVVDANRKMLEKLNKSLEDGTKKLPELENDLKEATAEYERLKNSTSASSEELENQQKKVDDATKALKTQKDALKTLERNIDSHTRALNNAETETVKLKRAQEETNDALKVSKNAVEKAKDALKNLEPVAAKVASAIVKVGKGALDVTGKLAKWTLAAGAAAATAAGATMIAGINTLIEWGEAAVEQAKAAEQAGEQLTATQQQWLAYGKTLEQFKTSSDKAKSAMATVLLPALTELSTKGGELLRAFSAEMDLAQGDPETMAKVISEYVTKAAEMLAEEIPHIMELAGEFIDALGEGFSEHKEEILDAAQKIISSLVDGAVEHADEIGEVIVTLIVALGRAIIDNGPELLGAGLKIMLQIVQGIADGLPEFIENDLPGLIDELLAAIEDYAPKFFSAGWKILSAMWDGLKEVAAKIDTWFVDLMNRIFGYTESIEAMRARVKIDPNDPGFYGRGYATGLNYVPYDDFPAYLHKGEMVLTASQASAYRSGGGSAGETGEGVRIVPVSIPVSIEMDGRKVAEQTYDYTLEIDRERGVSMSRR